MILQKNSSLVEQNRKLMKAVQASSKTYISWKTLQQIKKIQSNQINQCIIQERNRNNYIVEIKVNPQIKSARSANRDQAIGIKGIQKFSALSKTLN